MNRIHLSTHCDANGNWFCKIFKGGTDVARGWGLTEGDAVRSAKAVFSLPYQPLG